MEVSPPDSLTAQCQNFNLKSSERGSAVLGSVKKHSYRFFCVHTVGTFCYSLSNRPYFVISVVDVEVFLSHFSGTCNQLKSL